MAQGLKCSADWRAVDSASVPFPLRWVKRSFFVKQLTWFQSGFRPTRCFGRSLRRSRLRSLQLLMLAVFGVLVWVPHLIAHPRAHFNWSECVLTFLVTGAAWMVADLRSL